jgi:hypothetical protein
MLVLKSTHGAELDTAHRISGLACEQRDLSNEAAAANARSAERWRERAITAEAKVARMTGGLRQNRGKPLA